MGDAQNYGPSPLSCFWAMSTQSRNIVVRMKHLNLLTLVLCAVGTSIAALPALAQGIPDTARRIELPPRVEPLPVMPQALREDAPLDHDWSRGLTIVSSDRQMQLQVQASVRNLAVVNGHRLSVPSSFTTADIPVGDRAEFDPHFYDDLRQTRLAIVGMRESEVGRIVLRVETDFNGSDGFRLRHAYAEFGDVLVGQTWSLFSHVTLLPMMVDAQGPLGANMSLVPQVRYRLPELWSGTDLTVGAEFGSTTGVNSNHVLPDPIVRARRATEWGAVEASLMLPLLAGRYNNELEVQVGWGFSASSSVAITPEATLFVNAAFGQGIADAFPTLAGMGRTVHVDTAARNVELAFTASGFLAGEYRWTDAMRSSIAVSAITHDARAYDPSITYRWGWQLAANTFWDVFSGMRLGVEWAVGSRANVDAATGVATRISSLLYYEL